jgi:4'-phosphopantetheinyl transferase
MTDVGWLPRSLADVPRGDGWLTSAERDLLAGLRFPRRRADWRLGRWTAKAAVAMWLDVPPSSIAVLPGSDGAPAAWIGDTPAPVTLSLSHRAGWALAVVGVPGCAVGCDLELIEPRSRAFVAEWLAPDEQRRAAAVEALDRDRLVNAMWTAKEAAAKVRREGLRLDVRAAVTHLDGAGGGSSIWRPSRVDWEGEHLRTSGWWRAACRWVMAVASEPAAPPPARLG